MCKEIKVGLLFKLCYLLGGFAVKLMIYLVRHNLFLIVGSQGKLLQKSITLRFPGNAWSIFIDNYIRFFSLIGFKFLAVYKELFLFLIQGIEMGLL